MRNHLMVIFVIISLFMISGCDDDKQTSDGTESPYLGGNQGLIAEFLEMGVYNEDTKIEEIFEGETFPIEVMIKNKGEENVDIGDATVTLKGIAMDDFSGIANNGVLSNEEMIERVSEYNKAGGEVNLDFTPGAEEARYEIEIKGAHYDISVFGEVVYLYSTHAAVPKVCFKENLQTEGICEVDEEKTVYSSGAPIQVKSATEKRAGTGKVAVEFEVENVGGGDVTKPEEAFDSRFNQLSFMPAEPELWECKAGGKLNEGRFDSSNKLTVVCKLKEAMEEDTLYTKELDLVLSYKYRKLIHRQLRIRKQ